MGVKIEGTCLNRFNCEIAFPGFADRNNGQFVLITAEIRQQMQSGAFFGIKRLHHRMVVMMVNFFLSRLSIEDRGEAHVVVSQCLSEGLCCLGIRSNKENASGISHTKMVKNLSPYGNIFTGVVRYFKRNPPKIY
jgi:hypothetical protein